MSHGNTQKAPVSPAKADSQPPSSATAPTATAPTATTAAPYSPGNHALPEVPLRLSLPTPIYDQYVLQAATEGVADVEQFITEHLRQTAGQDHSGAGVYFDSIQAAALAKLTGRGPCRDPLVLLDRLRALAQITLGDIKLVLDANVLERISHNYRVRKGLVTAGEFAAKEATNGIRTSVGLAPR